MTSNNSIQDAHNDDTSSDPLPLSYNGSSGNEDDSEEATASRLRRHRSSPQPLRKIHDRAGGNVYEQTYLLGMDSFGYVHVAVDEKGTKVALKTFKYFDIKDTDVEQEWAACQKIRDSMPHHPNVVTPYSFFKDGIFPYTTMELCSHRTLDTLLKARKILQEHEVRHFGRQLVAGVLHLHSLKLLHGDLKPTNMMMTEEVVLKVGDFGQAEDMSEGNEYFKLVGSFYYQAPEVLQHRKHMYAVYAFAIGAILYRMLLGKTYSIPSNIVRGKKNELEIKVRISEMGMDLLNRALDSDPLTRISMSELAIHPFLVEEPIAGNLSWTSILEKPTPMATEDNAYGTKQGAIDKVKSVEGQAEGVKIQLEVPKSQDQNDETQVELAHSQREIPDAQVEVTDAQEEKTEAQVEVAKAQEENAEAHVETTEKQEESKSADSDTESVDLDDLWEQIEQEKEAKQSKITAIGAGKKYKGKEDSAVAGAKSDRDQDSDTDEEDETRARKKIKITTKGITEMSGDKKDEDDGSQAGWFSVLNNL